MKLYLVMIKDCVEPIVAGPFESEEERLDYAVKNSRQSDCVLAMLAPDTPMVRTYTNTELDSDLQLYFLEKNKEEILKDG